MKDAIKKAKDRLFCAILFFVLVLNCVGCIEVVEIPYSQVKMEDGIFEDKFYFSQLTEEEQLVYRELYQGIIEHEEKIYVHSGNAEKVNEILASVMYDFGEIFWTDGSATSTAYEESMWNDEYTIIEPTYVYTIEERETKEQEIESVVAQVTNSIPAQSTEYEIIKYIYEYLINTVSYVENAPDSQNLHSALVGKETVCAGYAKANQYLLNRLGIYCTYVIGTAAQEGKYESHAWNIVRCDGEYYYVDITWADPMESEEQAEIQAEMLYDYLCCSEKQLAETHRPDEKYDYPKCASEDLNYYRKNQMYYEAVNREQLLNAMYASVDAKEESTVFKFSDNALYQEANRLVQQDLINLAAERLARNYNLTDVMYYYEEQEPMNKLVIYWFYE